jgi:hypothetical protein
MKTIKIEDVVSISLINTSENKERIIFKLSNGNEYYANGDIEKIENSYYCHYEFTIWSNC